MVKHVWFDLGGTLYRETPEFEVVHDQQRYSEFAKIIGEEDLIRAKQQYDELYKEYGSNSAVFTSLGKPSDYWQKSFEQIDLTDLVKPNDDVTKTLASIKELVPISLFTNIRPAKIRSVLAQLEIPANDFTHILSGDDVSKRKPDPEGFHKMISLSGVKASEIMFVGDRVDVEVKPAHQLGILTCLVWGESAEADYSAPTFHEVGQIVRSLV